jgi:hypothetical protein
MVDMTEHPVSFKINDIITNGTSAGRVIEHVAKDPSWKVPGVRVANIGMGQFGGLPGYSSFVPDYLLYVWPAYGQRLARELRKAEER